MRILFVGWLSEGSTSSQRMRAFEDIGHKVLPINTQPDYMRYKSNSLLNRVLSKLLGSLDLVGVNARIAQMFSEQVFDVLWVEKGIFVKRELLERIKALFPKTILVHYNPDDPFGSFGRRPWKIFLEALPVYDFHLVPRKVNVPEYQGMGAKEVIQMIPFWGFSPLYHHPYQIGDRIRELMGGKVGFIGQYERERGEMMNYLVENGIPVRIWGSLAWQKNLKFCHPELRVENQTLWGDDYGRAICSFDINLAFLRKGNRDLHTSRSVEIPACGAFMLAERTSEHLELFEEGKEVEFFSSNEELFDKVKYYLKHEEERKRIAQAGRERCLRSGYSNADRMKKAIELILLDRNQGQL